MKKIIYILLLMAIPFLAVAQSDTYNAETLKAELELTNDQFEKITKFQYGETEDSRAQYFVSLKEALNIDQRKKFKEIYNIDLDTFNKRSGNLDHTDEELDEDKGSNDLEETGTEPHDDKRVDDRDIKVSPPMR